MDTKWLLDRPIAHRGLFDNEDIPENSLPAFKKAVDEGFDIELDVQLTRDGKLVVFHDYDLKRMCGADIKVKRIFSADLDKYKLCNTDHSIPLFEDVLALVDGKAGIVVEIKSAANYWIICRKVRNALKAYGKENVCVESFNPHIVTWFKTYANDVVRGQLASFFPHKKMPFKYMFKKMSFFNLNRPDFIAYDVNNIPNKYINKVLKRYPNTLLIAWTVKTDEQLATAKRHCDNFIFEQSVDPYAVIDEALAYAEET